MKQLILIFLLITSSFFAVAQDSTITFKVSGACGMCKERIEKAVKKKGVSTASWSVKSQEIKITYDPSSVTVDELHKRIADVGHDTELKKADDKIYKALPDCCLYRDIAAHDMEEEEVEATHDEHALTGVVLQDDGRGNFIPLAGASVIWLKSGAGTKTNEHGIFSIPMDETSRQLVVSYAGFRPDTIEAEKSGVVRIVLNTVERTNDVTVHSRRAATYVNSLSAFRTAVMTQKELFKAACCNLSESFETNPSVDVSYNDAVTGSKQIQLLGLSGNYTQLTVENLPGPRGLATPQGLNSIAGPWVESIQLTKGIGSVVNGYESIAGQINVELKKPETAEKLYVNGYINNMGKTDINVNLVQKISDKWSTALLLHDDFLTNADVDFNKDMFRDLPTGNLFSAVNRYKYDNNKGFMMQFGVKALVDEKVGGDVRFDKEHKLTDHMYGLGINTKRYEGFSKIGYVFPGKKYRSIGLQAAYITHQQDSYFGKTVYDAKQNNLYTNLIYQDIIGSETHKYKAGISFNHDRYDETLKGMNYKRTEIVPGAFAEYTFTPSTKFSLVAGLRADHNNLFGAFVTPRLNVRYAPTPTTTIRLSGGRGQRTANIFAENMSVFVSARNINILNAAGGKAYGLDAEVAWNEGISVDQKLRLFGRDANFSVDFFRNDFQNQVVVDLEDPRQVKFYNLEGRSYSNSFQAELNTTPLKGLDVRLAYRLFDLKTTYGDKLLSKPFTSKHRGFANLAYETGKWKFDYTVNVTGEKRIPSTAANPVEHRLPEKSPVYTTMNAQASKSFGKDSKWELYVGGENLTNYFQKQTIIGADEPFGEHFDASMIWGPAGGRLLYTGFRYRIK